MIEIESMPRSESRGRKALVAATAAALIAGTAGFLVGRSTGTPNASVGAAPSTEPTQAATTSPSAEATSLAPETAVPPPMTTSVIAGDVVAAPMPAGMYGGGAYEEPQQELLAERTTPGGVVLRAHLSRYPTGDQPYGFAIPGWKPAGWCYPQGSIRVSIVAPDSVNISGGSWFAELRNGVSVSTFASGYVEGSPIFGAVAQVDPDVRRVTMTTASGLTDTAAPTNGIALLQVGGKIEQEVTFTVTKSDNSSTSHPLSEFTQPPATSDYHTSCDPPPPPLPAAGEQPADPAAAAAAVRESWRIAHDFANTEIGRRESFVDDPTGIADAWKALQEGQYADAAQKSTANIAEIVFTSPTEAWFRYDILTPITNFYDQFGQARLGDDGVWRITRQTICQDIAKAPGSSCAPAVEPLLPPSAQNDPRYNPQLMPEGSIVKD